MDGSGANWFKIYALGANFSSGSLAWPSDEKKTFKFKIPSNTPAGNYLLRAEHIALHGASTVGGLNSTCAQLSITGNGSGNPAKVSIPGVYKVNHD
ncbi:Glycosyl hydrolase family 61 [Rhizoctonia solani]|uniref:lytic cellulose monooxygenase (C4-dehydrogenating) n=1 Tax=Rhizoctonia solani TaxID=456999 RepID=A0A8H7IFG1_9AGAM|nr:Glycosyl hydrolase family 61 [Rhizoctonia solani]